MFVNIKKTYGAKKASAIHHRKAILKAAPNGGAIFDALSVNNIKKYKKKQLSVSSTKPIIPLRKGTASYTRNLVHEVKTITQQSIELDYLDNISDRSLHVNRNEDDPFDQIIKDSGAASCKLPNNNVLIKFDPKVNLSDSSSCSLVQDVSIKKPEVKDPKKHPVKKKSSNYKVRKKKIKVFSSFNNENVSSLIGHRLDVVNTIKNHSNLSAKLSSFMKNPINLGVCNNNSSTSILYSNRSIHIPGKCMIPDNTQIKLQNLNTNLPSTPSQTIKSDSYVQLNNNVISSTPHSNNDVESAMQVNLSEILSLSKISIESDHLEPIEHLSDHLREDYKNTPSKHIPTGKLSLDYSISSDGGKMEILHSSGHMMSIPTKSHSVPKQEKVTCQSFLSLNTYNESDFCGFSKINILPKYQYDFGETDRYSPDIFKSDSEQGELNADIIISNSISSFYQKNCKHMNITEDTPLISNIIDKPLPTIEDNSLTQKHNHECDILKINDTPKPKSSHEDNNYKSYGHKYSTRRKNGSLYKKVLHKNSIRSSCHNMNEDVKLKSHETLNLNDFRSSKNELIAENMNNSSKVVYKIQELSKSEEAAKQPLVIDTTNSKPVKQTNHAYNTHHVAVKYSLRKRKPLMYNLSQDKRVVKSKLLTSTKVPNKQTINDKTKVSPNNDFKDSESSTDNEYVGSKKKNASKFITKMCALSPSKILDNTSYDSGDSQLADISNTSSTEVNIKCEPICIPTNSYSNSSFTKNVATIDPVSSLSLRSENNSNIDNIKSYDAKLLVNKIEITLSNQTRQSNNVTTATLPSTNSESETSGDRQDFSINPFVSRRRKKSFLYSLNDSDLFVVNDKIPDSESLQLQKSNESFEADDINVSEHSESLVHEIANYKHQHCFESPSKPRLSILLPGKKWERSLNIVKQLKSHRNTINQSHVPILQNAVNKGRKFRQSISNIIELQSKVEENNYSGLNTSNYQDLTSINHTHTGRITIVEERFLEVEEPTDNKSGLSQGLLSDACNDTEINLSRLTISEVDRNSVRLDKEHQEANWTGLDSRDVVLRRCNQSHPLPFDECYPEKKLQKCRKIGEGVYGEVFLYKNEDDPSNPIVMKVIPIEGDELVNGDHQKKFDEIISEIVIAMELSDLRNSDENKTFGFNKVHRVRCVKGRYPARLVELWELYDEQKGSENDCPTLFDASQLYIVLELANGGKDLEAFKFANAEQSYSLFYQIAFSLAVAEEAFQFEHRDLHWGNVLINDTDETDVKYTLRGIQHSLPSCGVLANVIDFTLSRITLPCAALTIFNNLAEDESLFGAVGDYQFEIYRLMQKKNRNLWRHFEPYTNILWLHYTLDKMISALRYERTNTAVHNLYISKLQELKEKILQYESCVDFVINEEY